MPYIVQAPKNAEIPEILIAATFESDAGGQKELEINLPEIAMSRAVIGEMSMIIFFENSVSAPHFY
ncbi:MAG TPA: hypothetical protein VK943_12025 [Arenibaculum sp.]|nr:hypothetical protein [Arenibaculum sp.]